MQQLTKQLMSWASILEAETLEQARRTSQLPFVHPHLALMPDAHLGRGATVGSVIPTLGAIIPAAVGVDTGCGMTAVKTQFDRADLPRDTAALHRAISAAVPLSAGRYNSTVTGSAEPRVDELEQTEGVEQANAVAPNWRHQLGSLGSGNHFIEASEDEDGQVWLFLHSCIPACGVSETSLPVGTSPWRASSARTAGSRSPTPISPTWSRATMSSRPACRHCGGRSGSRP